MRLRIKKYLSSPLGIYCRIKRDIPYLLHGTSFYADLERKQPPKQVHQPRHEQKVINDYWARHTQRKAKSAIYTCITNGYDDLSLIANHGYVNFDWDYICYTDDKEQLAQQRVGVWQVRPLVFTDLDATRNNRWHKLHPHLLLRDYVESIYIDANIDILSPYVFTTVRNIDKPFILPRHSVRTCIFEEYELFLSEFTEETARITAGWRLLKKNGMPKNFGLTENNILYRRHHEPEVVNLMEEWWKMLTTFSRRDQLSLMYLIWTNGLNLAKMTFPNARRLPNDFCVFKHTPKTLTK